MPGQHFINAILAIITVGFAISIYFAGGDLTSIIVFFSLALVLGIFITIPVGGADMPVIISLFNALTGLAVGFEGYVLGNAAMIINGDWSWGDYNGVVDFGIARIPKVSATNKWPSPLVST